MLIARQAHVGSETWESVARCRGMLIISQPCAPVRFVPGSASCMSTGGVCTSQLTSHLASSGLHAKSEFIDEVLHKCRIEPCCCRLAECSVPVGRLSTQARSVAMSWCNWCGEEGKGVIPLSKFEEGHIKCFVLQNVFEVLNWGRCRPTAVHVPVRLPIESWPHGHQQLLAVPSIILPFDRNVTHRFKTMTQPVTLDIHLLQRGRLQQAQLLQRLQAYACMLRVLLKDKINHIAMLCIAYMPQTALGCRELKCPSGTWNVNWLVELPKHVRPEISSQVHQLMEILIQVRKQVSCCVPP